MREDERMEEKKKSQQVQRRDRCLRFEEAINPISKVGKISQSWWIKFPWLLTHRASFSGRRAHCYSTLSHHPRSKHNLTLHSWINTNTSDTKDSKQKPSCTLSWLTPGSTKLVKSFNFWIAREIHKQIPVMDSAMPWECSLVPNPKSDYSSVFHSFNSYVSFILSTER